MDDKRILSENEKKKYRKYAEKHAPSSALFKDCLLSFIVGGIICVIGQGIGDLAGYLGVSEENVKTVIPVCLIFLSCLLTGIGVYDNIASFAKAGTLVPITGFANAVCACAIDAKSEGFVLGVGAKMFTIAGPVIVYGSVSSVIWGVIYYFIK
jgi:stage V sporulation protein AC